MWQAVVVLPSGDRRPHLQLSHALEHAARSFADTGSLGTVYGDAMCGTGRTTEESVRGPVAALHGDHIGSLRTGVSAAFNLLPVGHAPSHGKLQQSLQGTWRLVTELQLCCWFPRLVTRTAQSDSPTSVQGATTRTLFENLVPSWDGIDRGSVFTRMKRVREACLAYSDEHPVRTICRHMDYILVFS